MHATTRYTPFFLLFGRQARLPLDLILLAAEDSMERSPEQWIWVLARWLQEARNLVMKEAHKEVP